jgi:hypothetical protein
VSTRSWRRRGAALALPVVLASGCLLVAPPEDLPALGTSGTGAQGGGGSGGSSAGGTSGTGASTMTGGDAGSESNPEGGSPASGGSAGEAGSGDTGANGGRGGAGGSAGSGGRGGAGATGGTSESMGGAGEGGAPGCTTNQECVTRTNSPARCRSDHTCAELASNECLNVYGPYTDANALYIGAFAVVDPANPGTSDIALAMRLAVDEINTAGGLPGGPDGKRPLVLNVCTNDQSVEPNAISLGMTHLAEDVQVPALIAMLQPDDLTSALQQEKEKALFFLNPVATVRSLMDLQTLQGNGAKGDVLLWTLLGQPSDYAPAYGLLLSDLEKQVRSERGLMESDQIKVALVNTTDKFSDELRFYIFQSLFFNGASAANEAPDNYKEYSLDPNAVLAEDTVTALATFAPDIVISAAGDVVTAPSGVIPRLEAGWTSSKPRPFYLLSPYNGTTDAKNSIQSVVTHEFDDSTNPEPDAARRFLGVNAAPALDTSLENAFESRYNVAFSAQQGNGPNVDNYYDAVYYLAYAMYAGDSLAGPGIAHGMKRLISGDPFDDGPANMAIQKVFDALDASDSISLNTTLGPSDPFDPVTGVRPVIPGVFCFTFNASLTLRPKALRYDSTSDTFTGTYPCLDNFPPP